MAFLPVTVKRFRNCTRRQEMRDGSACIPARESGVVVRKSVALISESQFCHMAGKNFKWVIPIDKAGMAVFYLPGETFNIVRLRVT